MAYYVLEAWSVSGTWYPIKNCITDRLQGNKVTSGSHIPPPVSCRGEVHSVTPYEILLSAVTAITSYFVFLRVFGSSLENYHLLIIYLLRYGRWAQQRTNFLRNSLNRQEQYQIDVLSTRREMSGSTRSPEMEDAWLYSRPGRHIPFVLSQRMHLYVISGA